MFFKFIVLTILLILICFIAKSPTFTGKCGKKFESFSQESANMLCKIHGRCKKLVNLVKGEHGKLLRFKYQWHDLAENLQPRTYNVGKGEKIYICLRNSHGKLYDFNTLMFVAIHELAHILTKTYDIGSSHSGEYWRLNKKLLDIAQHHQLYTFVNYRINPVEYCGILINNQP